ncbi:MAG: hypothetical protein QQN41_13425, partial [Nitrosopumilus sp.]
NSVQQLDFKPYKRGIYSSIAYIAYLLTAFLLSNINLLIDVIILSLFLPITLGLTTANIFYGIKGLKIALKKHNYKYIIFSALALLVGIVGIFSLVWAIIGGFGFGTRVK